MSALLQGFTITLEPVHSFSTCTVFLQFGPRVYSQLLGFLRVGEELAPRFLTNNNEIRLQPSVSFCLTTRTPFSSSFLSPVAFSFVSAFVCSSLFLYNCSSSFEERSRRVEEDESRLRNREIRARNVLPSGLDSFLRGGEAILFIASTILRFNHEMSIDCIFRTDERSLAASSAVFDVCEGRSFVVDRIFMRLLRRRFFRKRVTNACERKRTWSVEIRKSCSVTSIWRFWDHLVVKKRAVLRIFRGKIVRIYMWKIDDLARALTK
ncbi:hypothetical protein ANTQUA_LOCUS2453 [Anthophora quadrimaculata]